MTPEECRDGKADYYLVNEHCPDMTVFAIVVWYSLMLLARTVTTMADSAPLKAMINMLLPESAGIRDNIPTHRPIFGWQDKVGKCGA